MGIGCPTDLLVQAEEMAMQWLLWEEQEGVVLPTAQKTWEKFVAVPVAAAGCGVVGASQIQADRYRPEALQRRKEKRRPEGLPPGGKEMRGEEAWARLADHSSVLDNSPSAVAGDDTDSRPGPERGFSSPWIQTRSTDRSWWKHSVGRIISLWNNPSQYLFYSLCAQTKDRDRDFC